MATSILFADSRRRHPREPVRFHVLFEDGESFDIATVENVSDGGLFVRTEQPLVPGTEVHLAPLGEVDDLLDPVRARVAWSSATQPGGMGLEFLEPPAEFLAALERVRARFGRAA
ncbi:MAG: hypothetical protein D6705_03565 [Deltaproteobacteria bacterium]|nr:MAG: hypothetical protein D6705_03565 [Deltaproteobacteria bacterium]